MNHTLVFAKSNALAKVIVYKSCDKLSVLKKFTKEIRKKIRKDIHQKKS